MITASEFSKKLNKISEMLNMGKEMINEDPILKFQDASVNILEQLEEIMQEGRKLKLGIVGEVKAGKSSFLNALLFEGKNILPKAPTPMTAALTKISYSETPKAKIVFYEKNDWKGIELNAEKYEQKMKELYTAYKDEQRQKAKESGVKKQAVPPQIISYEEFEKENAYRMPEAYKACKEVYDLAQKSMMNIGSLLGTEKIIEGDPNDEYGYLKMLEDYVGAEGKYTAIVKYTEIQMSNKMLEGIEVIDTPGLNDPILSRGRTTQQFLIECDAVFMLGYCGQFLGAEDMNFLFNTLPGEGINKAVLIGSKMDSAILQYPSKGSPSFKVAYVGTKRACEQQAETNLEKCTVTPYNEKILERLKESLPPKCISSVAYSAALHLKNGEELDNIEKTMINNFSRRFPDFNASIELLEGLSNIPDVRTSVFEETKKQKEQIIAERSNDIIFSQTGKFTALLEDIIIRATQNKNDLQESDLEQLETQLKQIKEGLDSIRFAVRNLFDKASNDAKLGINDIAINVYKEINNHRDMVIEHSTKQINHKSTSGHLFWKKTDRWTETKHIDTVPLSNVYSNIREYNLQCMQIVNTRFRSLIKIEQLKEDIQGVFIKAFSNLGKDFDENRILVPLNNTLQKITIPELTLSASQYENMLDGELTGKVSDSTVKNKNIPILKSALDRVLEKMSEDITEKIKKEGNRIANELEKQSGSFVDDVKGQLEENKQKIETMLHNKQESMEKFNIFLTELNTAKSMIRELES